MESAEEDENEILLLCRVVFLYCSKYYVLLLTILSSLSNNVTYPRVSLEDNTQYLNNEYPNLQLLNLGYH